MMRFRDWLGLAPIFLRSVGRLPAGHLWYLAGRFRDEHPQRHDGRIHINSFFPPWPSAAFERFLDSVIARRRVPYSCYFAVTDQCPYHCEHCSYGSHRRGRVDTTQAIDIIEQIKALGTVSIGFTGGEPLLREDIVELVAAVGDDMASIVFTTGYGFDGELAERLKQAGLGCLMVGIESDDVGEHDRVRAVSGSFEQAIRAIETSVAAGLYTAISTVGTRDRITGGVIARLARLAERHGVHEFRILEPVPTGRLYGQNDAVLTPAESEQLTRFHRQWNRRNRGPAICSFSHMESDALFGCGAGFHHLFIDAVGNVCPCDLTPLSFGTVLDRPLAAIWEEMAQWFALPRCGCLMKAISREAPALEPGQRLPLEPEQSIKLCRKVLLPPPHRLPGVYQRLFKDRTPAGPPSNRP